MSKTWWGCFPPKNYQLECENHPDGNQYLPKVLCWIHVRFWGCMKLSDDILCRLSLISDLRFYLMNCKNHENCTRHFTTSVSTNSTKSASVQHSIFICLHASSNPSSFRINNTTFRGGIESEGSCFDRSHEWTMLWAGHKMEDGLDWAFDPTI